MAPSLIVTETKYTVLRPTLNYKNNNCKPARCVDKLHSKTDSIGLLYCSGVKFTFTALFAELWWLTHTCRNISACVPVLNYCMFCCSAFFWLVALMFSSLLWFIPGPKKTMLLVGVMFSVAFQEVFRLLYYFVLRWVRLLDHGTTWQGFNSFDHPVNVRM